MGKHSATATRCDTDNLEVIAGLATDGDGRFYVIATDLGFDSNDAVEIVSEVNVRDLDDDVTDRDAFIDTFLSALRRQLEDAWSGDGGF